MSKEAEDILSTCCSDLVDIHTEEPFLTCRKCQKECGTKPKTLEINVSDEINMKDVVM